LQQQQTGWETTGVVKGEPTLNEKEKEKEKKNHQNRKKEKKKI